MRNRRVTLRLEKDKKANDPKDNFEEETLFERKAYIAKRAIESTAAKMFAGVCVYIVLDTYRQVQVAKASNPS